MEPAGIAAAVAALLIPSFSDRKHEEVLQASSLLTAEYCRAVHVLRRLTPTDGIDHGAVRDGEQQQRLLLMMKDVMERLYGAKELLSFCHQTSDVSLEFGLPKVKERTKHFLNVVRWATAKKEVLLQLHTCAQLNDAVYFCTEQRDLGTLKSMLELLEESRALSRGQTELRDGRLKAFERHFQRGNNAALIDMPKIDDPLKGLEEMLLLKNRHKTPFTTVQQLPFEPFWNLSRSKVTPDEEPALVLKPKVIDDGRAALLKPMYDLATEGLFIISRVLASAEIASLYDRLKMWGRGLFHGAYDLTKMLAEYPDYSTDADDGQCSAFHNSFIVVLLEIEQILIIFQSANAAVEDFQARLSKFLQADTPLQTEILKRTLFQSEMLNEKSDKDEKGIAGYVGRVSDEVDNLFTLLPAVQTLRDIYRPPGHTQLEMVD